MKKTIQINIVAIYQFHKKIRDKKFTPDFIFRRPADPFITVPRRSSGSVQDISGTISHGRDWIKNNALEMGIAFIGGLMVKGGWTLMVKAFARNGVVITKEADEFFAGSSTFLIAVNNAIKDDGSIGQNNIDDAITAGKEVVAEGRML